MNRRDLMTLIGGAAAWPVAARAQVRATPVVGVLRLASPDASEPLLSAFRRGLGETGLIGPAPPRAGSVQSLPA
jgi:putative ABC transport system substrate-binding protein